MSGVSFGLKVRNPDVLNTIANLSSDEVFTPPQFANRMLDTLETAWAADHDGESIWSRPDVTFLDPATKSGVFLREIATRLIRGLADTIPDLQERVDHVLTKQLFGIGMTTLTALLARRSLYCSKDATGVHSVANSFDRHWGNVWFERTEHTWADRRRERTVDPATGDEVVVEVPGSGRCGFCGANETSYARAAVDESHAYAFIHTADPQRLVADLFGAPMQFDVVIGNPPYQLDDGGAGKSAAPIYHRFVMAAEALEPRYLTMVTPSRWMAGGKGLDEFRAHMLTDDRLRIMVDFLDSDEAFPGVDIAGGVSYFLWNRDRRGPCKVTTVLRGHVGVARERRLDEYDVFVRHSDAVEILRKVWPEGHLPERSLAPKVSGRKAFGFATTDRGSSTSTGMTAPVTLVSSGGEGFVERDAVSMHADWIDKWKATVSRAAPAGGRPDRDGRYYGLSSIRVIGPGVVTTEAYPVVGAYETETEAERMCAYLSTRFVRFLISLRASNQSVARGTFAFVPDLAMDRLWTDADLYTKYGISPEEIAYIESLVRPMELDADRTEAET